jgi:hypothetical protein
MKKIRFVSVLLIGVMAAALCHADLIYSEGFVVPTNSGISAVGWHSNLGSTGIAANETLLDGSNSPLVVATSGGFLFHKPAGIYIGTPILNWTDEFAFGAINTITNMSASIINNITTEDLKFAIKVDGAWYVSQTAYNSPVGGGGGASRTNITINVQSALWNSLILNPGTTLAEGGAASLPLSGAVQAVGIFDASASGSQVRYENFNVSAIPEPATLGLLGVSSLGLLLFRRHIRS